MSEEDWRNLHLLREPGNNALGLAKVRLLLTDIMNFTTTATASETMWRGHRSIDHKLCPSVARNRAKVLNQSAVTTTTTKLLRNANDASHYWRDGHFFRSLNELQQLALIQHRLTGTPLLDITPDPMIALWMACQGNDDSEDSNDGLLIGLNNWGDTWKDFTHSKTSYPEAIRELSGEGINARIGWFRPIASSDRAIVQRSRFLLAPMIRPPSRGKRPWYEPVSDVVLPKMPQRWSQAKLEAVFESTRGQPAKMPIVGFLIRSTLKSEVLEVLRKNFGIERDTVFPDIHALDG